MFWVLPIYLYFVCVCALNSCAIVLGVDVCAPKKRQWPRVKRVSHRMYKLRSWVLQDCENYATVRRHRTMLYIPYHIIIVVVAHRTRYIYVCGDGLIGSRARGSYKLQTRNAIIYTRLPNKLRLYFGELLCLSVCMCVWMCEAYILSAAAFEYSEYHSAAIKFAFFRHSRRSTAKTK